MELDQYSGDLEVDFEDEIKVQARPWLGLAVGIFVGIVLGGLSADSLANSFYWIKLGSIFSLISWGLVCLAHLIFRIVNKRIFKIEIVPRFFKVVGLLLLVCGMGYLLGPLFNFQGTGVILTLLPSIFFISVFWTKPERQSFGLASVAIFGTGIFLLSFKLFTIPAVLKAIPPNEPALKVQSSDTRLLAFNLRRWGIFSQRGIEDTSKLAKIINDEKVEFALFQGIPNKNFLDQLLSNLGDNWTSAVFSEDKNQTAIISKIGKVSEAFRSEVADISMVAFEKDGNLVRYVSCNSPSGRKSQERRELVDWLLKQYRKENELIVVAGNFNFNPHDRWSFLSPMITDSISYDRASWKALSLLGDIFGYSPNSDQPIRRLNMKQEWVIVSPGIELVSKTLPNISISDGSATVMTLRIMNSKNDLNGNSPSVETLN